MGAKVNESIAAVKVENEYSPGSHTYEEVKIEFNSVSDILILSQNGNEITMEIGQVFDFLEVMLRLKDKIN